jgi:hypothetical protein
VQNAVARGKVRSLLDVLRFYAESFVSAMSTIAQITHILNRQELLSDQHLTELGHALGRLGVNIAELDLPMTTKHLRRMRDDVDANRFHDYKVIEQQLRVVLPTNLDSQGLVF